MGTVRPTGAGFRDFIADRRKVRAVAGVVAAILLAGCVYAYRLARRPEEIEVPPGVAVGVYRVARQDVVQTTRLSGALTPRVNLNLVCKVSGQVERIAVELGEAVSEGQVLLEISQSDIWPQFLAAQAGLEAARASLVRVEQGATREDAEQARAALMQAQAGWDAAIQAYERMAFLYREGAISRQQFEAAETQVKVATSQLSMAQLQLRKVEQGADDATVQMARAQVEQADAAYEVARAMLQDTVLRAPCHGIISYVQVDEGELVAPGMPQIGLVDATTVYLEAAVTEATVARLKRGAPVEVLVPAIGAVRQATVEQISPAADPWTKMFQVRIAIPNEGGELKGGMTGETRVETGLAEGVLAVPRDALIQSGADRYVFIVEDGTAVRRDVTIGLAGETMVAVQEGLTEGEQVVAVGAEFLQPGSAVRAVREVAP